MADLDDFEPFGDQPLEETNVIAPFAPGSFFGDRFRIDDTLGMGAMGTVFRATDLLNGEPVALKVLLKQRQDVETRQRFAREAEILSRMKHPGVVRIRGFGHASGRFPWLAMELIEGETLGARVRRKGALDPKELVPIVRAISETLQAAHQAGVIHRDLKPDHIFLQPGSTSSVVKIIDFGLSSAAMTKKLTRTGTVMGTPRYMAPELFSSARNASAASDIYALAITVYEALTGESPFAASDHGQLLGAILQGKTEPLSKHRSDLSQKIDDVLARAMSKEPTDRPSTPLEFASAFAGATGVRMSAPPHFASYDNLPAIKRSVSPNGRYLLLAIMGIAVGVASGLATFYLLQ